MMNDESGGRRWSRGFSRVGRINKEGSERQEIEVSNLYFLISIYFNKRLLSYQLL
jgi:hypothetical protein